MSRRGTPRRLSEEPWAVWSCALPTVGCLVVLTVVTTALWTFFLGGGLGEGMIYGLVVVGGIVCLLYAVAKYYS
jgi:hypothetical protein